MLLVFSQNKFCLYWFFTIVPLFSILSTSPILKKSFPFFSFLCFPYVDILLNCPWVFISKRKQFYVVNLFLSQYIVDIPLQSCVFLIVFQKSAVNLSIMSLWNLSWYISDLFTLTFMIINVLTWLCPYDCILSDFFSSLFSFVIFLFGFVKPIE